MDKKRIAILGATGFLGKNLSLNLNSVFEVFEGSRKQSVINENSFFFDLDKIDSWENVLKCQPEYIINCIGYGVVRNESNIERMFEVNYTRLALFFDYLFTHFKGGFIQIGTAFEYDLNNSSITESSNELPKTYYGISKLMASKYLLAKYQDRKVIILRPFNMFGPFENESKIVPTLIRAVKYEQQIDLSDGLQKRDYFFVTDLCRFILKVIVEDRAHRISKIINVGPGTPQSIKDIASLVESLYGVTGIKSFYKWGVLPRRSNEGDIFYNGSDLCKQLGFEVSALNVALQETAKAY